MKEPLISVKEIHKIYDGEGLPVHAVRGVDLEIGEGEFSALVGPSGSGKTTLLNIIGGLDQASEGSVVLAGTDVAGLSGNELIEFRLHNIGFVFQAYNLIPVLTAKENVEFVMLLQKRPKAERDARVKQLLADVGLADKLTSRPAQLSGGQQQRVAVARALASKPRFVLADEPTANLDSKSAEQLLNIMQELNEKEGITFLFSTHDQRVVDRARRVVNLVDGQVVSDETK